MLRPVEEADRQVRVDPDGTLHLSAGCDLLTHLYANHGVRVRMVRRSPKKEKIPTVRQLIDHLAKKHELLLGTHIDLAAKSSCSTGTVPLSNTQGTHLSGKGAGSSSHRVAGGNVGGWDHRSIDPQKLEELDRHGNNTRPLSRYSTSRRTLSLDKVAFDREREDLRPIANSVSTNKQVPLWTNGFKNNLLRADQYLAQRSHGSAGGEEDLVAMGTLWSPNYQTHGSGTITTTTITTTTTTTTTTAVSPAVSTSSSTKSISASLVGNGNSGSGSGAFSSSSGTLPSRRPLPGTTSTWHALHHSSSLTAPAMGNITRSTKEVDPKYSDPVMGATPTFQQRLMELAALEAETVRWERGKKMKKKPPKQERDS